MMLVSGLFGSLFAAGGTAAAGAATAGAAAGAASAGIGSMGMTLLQGIGGVFTALSTIQAGQAQANQYKAQAEEEEFKARDELIKGDIEAAKLNKDLRLTMQRQQVAFAAAGVDLGSQAVGAAADEATTDAERELSYNFFDSTRAMLARRRSAANLRMAAKQAKSEAMMGAVTGLLQTGADMLYRAG